MKAYQSVIQVRQSAESLVDSDLLELAEKAGKDFRDKYLHKPYSYDKDWSGLSSTTRKAELGQAKDYYATFYTFFSDFVHGNPNAWGHLITEEEGIIAVSIGPQEAGIKECIPALCHTLSKALQIVAQVFGFATIVTKAIELQEQVEHLLPSLDAKLRIHGEETV